MSLTKKGEQSGRMSFKNSLTRSINKIHIELQDLVDNGELSSMDANKLHWHRIFEDFAKKGYITYSKTDR